MADKRFSIYYLLDPITGRVRYVGGSCRPSARLEDHLKVRGESHRARWQRQLLVRGLQPIFVIKCVVETEAEMFRIEMALIAKLRANGELLTNMTAGGEGIVSPSLEIRAKRSASMIGNTKGVGHKRSEETKEKQRASRKRFNAEHPEVVAHIATQQIGNKRGVGAIHSEASRRSASEKQKGVPRKKGMVHSLESLAHRQTPEYREAMRASMKSSWANRKAAGTVKPLCMPQWTEDRRAKFAATIAARNSFVPRLRINLLTQGAVTNGSCYLS